MILVLFVSIDNDIDGVTFSELTEDDVKAIVKPLVVVKKIIGFKGVL